MSQYQRSRVGRTVYFYVHGAGGNTSRPTEGVCLADKSTYMVVGKPHPKNQGQYSSLYAVPYTCVLWNYKPKAAKEQATA